MVLNVHRKPLICQRSTLKTVREAHLKTVREAHLKLSLNLSKELT